MSAFASSVINKSGKKLVPKKAPARRTTKATTPKSQRAFDAPQSPRYSKASSKTGLAASKDLLDSRSNEQHLTPATPTRTDDCAPTTTATQTVLPTTKLTDPPPNGRATSHEPTPVTENEPIQADPFVRTSSSPSINRASNSNEVLEQPAVPSSGSDIRRSQRLLSRPQKSPSTVNSAIENRPLRNQRRKPDSSGAQSPDHDHSLDVVAARLGRLQSPPATRTDGAKSDGTPPQPTLESRISNDESSKQLQAVPNDVGSSESIRADLQPQRATGKRKRQTRNDIERDLIVDSQDDRVQRRQGRKRRSTPITVETSEIEPSKATLSDLCKDTHQGKKSKRESLLEGIDWDQVKRRKQEERDKEQDNPSQAELGQDATPQLLGPQMRIVNDEFVLDEATQVIDEHARIVEEANVDGDAIDESSLTKRVNQATIGRQKTKDAIRWDEENTEKFYEGLRVFGTDLLMIGNQMFDGISRHHLKRKYVKEEHEHPERLRKALLGSRHAHSKKSLQAVRELDYEDPAKIYADLAAVEKTLEENYAKEQEEDAGGGRRKKKKGQEQDTDTPVTKENGDGTSKDNRHEANIHGTAEEAAAKKRGRTTGSSRKRNQRNKGADVGTEEILGSVEEIQ